MHLVNTKYAFQRHFKKKNNNKKYMCPTLPKIFKT